MSLRSGKLPFLGSEDEFFDHKPTHDFFDYKRLTTTSHDRHYRKDRHRDPDCRLHRILAGAVEHLA